MRFKIIGCAAVTAERVSIIALNAEKNKSRFLTRVDDEFSKCKSLLNFKCGKTIRHRRFESSFALNKCFANNLKKYTRTLLFYRETLLSNLIDVSVRNFLSFAFLRKDWIQESFY